MMNNIKLLSLFSGIGAFEKALTNLNINYKLVGFSEIDKYAVSAYCAIHDVDKNLNLGDITKIDNNDLPNCDMITYGFPCQDISIAGDQKGITEDTRSGLLYEAERIIQWCKPKYAIAENVKNLIGKKHINDFYKLLKRLDNYGYNNYWQILNAKDYGIPQSRERVFVISIRKDVDNKQFKFPQPFYSGLRLRDMLEEIVDEKYYLSDKEITYMNRQLKDGTTHWDFGHNSNIENDVSQCIVANFMKGVPYNVLRIGSINLKGHDLCKRIYSSLGCSSTIPTGQSGNTVPKILVEKIARKFTPLECFRLMGFADNDYWKVRSVLEKEFYNGKDRSNSQIYKMAGNSIVVNVLEKIFKNLLV